MSLKNFNMIFKRPLPEGFKSPKVKGDLPMIVTFDAIVKKSFEYRATVSKNPVENGAPVSDHILHENGIFELEAFVSNSPMDDKTWMKGMVASSINRLISDAGADKLADQTGIFFDALPFSESRPDRCIAVKETLRAVMLRDTPFDLVTRNEVVKNCVITGLGGTFESKEGDGLTFSITLEQINTIEFESFEVKAREKASKPAEKLRDRTAIKSAKTPVASKEVTGPQEKSWMMKGLDYFRGGSQ